MADKRSDDFVVRLPDMGLGGDKGRFVPRSASRRATAVPETVASFLGSIEHSGGASVVAYCLSSISMTLVNKYVVSGNSWNLHLLYLAIQVCLSHAGCPNWPNERPVHRRHRHNPGLQAIRHDQGSRRLRRQESAEM